MLLWWDGADGTRFNRAMTDVHAVSTAALRENPVIDPWGSRYVEAQVTATNRSRSFVFSLGPDRQSETLGNDPDDIAPWTKRRSWLAEVHSTKMVACLFAIALAAVVSSGSFLLGRHRHLKIQAQQGVGGQPATPPRVED